MILIPALLVTSLYGWQTTGRPTAFWSPAGVNLPLPTPSSTNPFAMPAVQMPTVQMPAVQTVNPSLVSRGQQVTGKALDVADQALQVTGTAVDASGKVVNFGADLIQQTLPPAKPGTVTPNSQTGSPTPSP